MTDYIKRTDAVKIAEKYGLANGSVLGRHTGLADCIASEILSLPAADVAPVLEGKWIVHYTTAGKLYTECASCHTDFSFKTDKGTVAKLDMRGMLYCPHCGAKMDGGKDNG
mgnify:CR=1 FL=1